MNIFIDTAVKGCNVALFDQDNILAKVQEPIERGHAEEILPLYEGLMKSTGKTAQDIENVYVTVGPGSFTGLRVGLSVARFIGFSLNIPVHGITSFQTFSSHVKSDKDRCVVVETKRSDFYVQILDCRHNPLKKPQSVGAGDISDMLLNYPDCVITGDAVGRLMDEIGGNEFKTQSQNMIDIECVIGGIQSEDLKLVAPDAFYIRDADVSQPKARVTSQQHS